MEPDDIALIHRMRASSLDQTTKMPWFATNKSQWDQDMETTSLELTKSERVEAWRALHEKPRLPAPNLDNAQSISSSSSSSSSTSSSSSAEASMASQAHPAAEAMAGETEFSWAVHAPRRKLYLHSLKGGACIVDSGSTSR